MKIKIGAKAPRIKIGAKAPKIKRIKLKPNKKTGRRTKLA